MKFLASALFLLFSTSVFADYCGESKIIDLTFDSAKYDELELKALAGDLEVSASGDDDIHFWGKVCTDDQHHLDMIDLDVLTQDKKLILAAIIPYHQDDFDPYYATMDIELSVPASLPLRLRDSSGDMRVTGVSLISVEDSSGNIRVLKTRANLSIRDSSGEIYVRGVDGDIRVSDSSGDIDLNDIAGTVTIPGDSSGGIEISGVGESVNIDRDSSGDIEVEDVGKDVIIGSDGSGDISIENVKGMVQIQADGSGSVEVEEVVGNFELRNKGAGDIRTADIGGTVDVPR